MRVRWSYAMPFAIAAIGLSEGRAVTIDEALAADQIVKSVDAMPPEARAAYLRDHRSQLGESLAIEQIVAAILHSVEVTSKAAERIYHHPILCGLDAGAVDLDDRPAAPQGRPAAIDLAGMAADYKSDVRASLNLPDTPATGQRLGRIDVTEMIANRLIEEKRCPNNEQNSRH